MASVERVVLVCDGCGADDTADGNGRVEAHRLSVDGVSWTVDSCGVCWQTRYREALAPLTQYAARVRIPARTRRLKSVG